MDGVSIKDLRSSELFLIQFCCYWPLLHCLTCWI